MYLVAAPLVQFLGLHPRIAGSHPLCDIPPVILGRVTQLQHLAVLREAAKPLHGDPRLHRAVF